MLTSDLMSRTFSDDSLLRLVPDGSGFIVVSRPIAANIEAGRYQVTRYGPDGRVQWSRGHDYRPRRVATVHGRSVHASMVDTYTSLGVFPTRAQVDAMVRDNFPVPGFYPPVTDAVIGRDDTVWLRGPETLDSTIEWTVLNAQGGLLERVILPSAVTVRDARGGAVWGVVLDPDGLPVIVRYVTP
jgi:hypothetical protein